LALLFMVEADIPQVFRHQFWSLAFAACKTRSWPG